jgi:predicted house-cleaning noncanonical NTP pyrophosphatase (MazG superfamily)
MTYKKLVRDNIPAIMKSKGQEPIFHVLDDESYRVALLKKLVEEAQELLESPGDIGERADVAEVLLAIDKAFNLEPKAIEKARHAKAEERGAFADKLFLEGVL